MSTLARVVFVLLVGATFSAFFVAQRLKSAPSVVEVRRLTEYFSPNADGRRDLNPISFRLTKPDEVTVSIVSSRGDEVRRLADARAVEAFTPARFTWDGRDDAGRRVPDGRYRLRIALRRQGRVVNAPGGVLVDTAAPRPRVVSVDPPVGGPKPGRFRIALRGVSRRKRTGVRIVRTDLRTPAEVARYSVPAGARRADWDGQVDGAPAPPGLYLVVPSVEDRAGNVGSVPTRLPAARGDVRGKPGITVRTISGGLPAEPVRSGDRIRFFVDSRRRDYRWSVRRLGSGRVAQRGRGRPGRPLIVRAPRGVSGVHLLEVAKGPYSATVPFAVQSGEREKMLVVLPVISWLGLDRSDDDGDGIPDTLETGGPVRYAPPRLLGGGGRNGLPAGFSDQVAPLLTYLDRARIRYDLTTDLALAASREPRVGGDRTGVLLPGSLRWVPRDVAQRLRRFADVGGRVATFGTETLRRGVAVASRELMRPTQPTPLDPFGARLGPERPLERPLAPTADDDSLGLLAGFDGVLEGFDRFEPSAPRPAGDRARVVTALVPEVPEDATAEAAAAALPAFTATRLGKGVVIRVGLPGWARRIRSDAEVDQLTHNVADVLRRVRPRTRSPIR